MISPGCSAVANGAGARTRAAPACARCRGPAITTDVGGKGRQRHQPVGRRVGMGQAAADRAAVAHGAVGDAPATAASQPGVASGTAPSSISAWVVAGAVGDGASPSSTAARSSGARDDLDQREGRASRRFSIGPSDWPPASGLPPASASSRRACRKVPRGCVARTAAGFTLAAALRAAQPAPARASIGRRITSAPRARPARR